ncbi:hypothetical protein Q7P37_005541 [Cladosporium fusiforme]
MSAPDAEPAPKSRTATSKKRKTTQGATDAQAHMNKHEDSASENVRFNKSIQHMITQANTMNKDAEDDVFKDVFKDMGSASTNLVPKSIAYEEPLPERSEVSKRTKDREIAKPEIKRMSWEEWRKTGKKRGKGTRKDHSAIDVLCEEPQPQWAANRSSFLWDTETREATTLESWQDVNSKEQGPLPARIRINSVPAKRLLGSLCDDKLVYRKPADPLIILRPYKVLVTKKEQIYARMAEIGRIYDERIKKKKSKIEASQELEAASKADDPSDVNEDHIERKNCNDVDTNIANGNNKSEADIDENAELLAQREFPNGLIFYTGTDWSILTLAEIKEAVDDFRCLVRFIEDYLQPVRAYLQSQPTSVNFSDLWHLFPTGCYVYCKERTIPQKIWRVNQATGGRRYLSKPSEEIPDWDTKYSPFMVDCYYLDFDGRFYIRVYRRFTIEMFEEPRPTEALEIMPLAVAEKLLPGINREEFRQRGMQFLAYTKPQHRYYHGTTVTQAPRGETLYTQYGDDRDDHRLFTERVESQVVVDFERGIQANPGWGPVIDDKYYLGNVDQAELDDGFEYAEKDYVWDDRASEKLQKELNIKQVQWNKGESVPEGDDLLLLPERVFGFVLRTRSWACLRLGADDSGREHLTLVAQRVDPWQDLEIPSGHKSIVQALIKTHFSKDKVQDAQFDLVREKGKGVIILLHGVPGVGKTATAECVAASYGKPLLPITCGDLGLMPEEVEDTLQTAFQLAQSWDCIMLLDEADIFLAQRTNQDIERNALVSVFLRVLEYFEGILFLTTNRVGVFDEAFKSRIHMALYYPPLNWPTTEKIWRNLIRRTCESSTTVKCKPDELIEFAWKLYEEQDKNLNSTGPVWNGRQIRNAFQSAIALARSECSETQESVMVQPSHFETVAKVSNEFNNYIWRVKSGRTDADVAKEVQTRYDDFSRASYTQGPSQSQAHQFPPPAQTPMPMLMRQTTPNVAPFQVFQTPQSLQQQPVYTNVTGSPYNPNQPAVYTNAQPPPQFNLAPAYGTQQPQYAQPLQAPVGQFYQGREPPSGQQYQTAQNPPVQQYQTTQTQPPFSPQHQPGTQHGYPTAGVADPTLPQVIPASQPHA